MHRYEASTAKLKQPVRAMYEYIKDCDGCWSQKWSYMYRVVVASLVSPVSTRSLFSTLWACLGPPYWHIMPWLSRCSCEVHMHIVFLLASEMPRVETTWLQTVRKSLFQVLMSSILLLTLHSSSD